MLYRCCVLVMVTVCVAGGVVADGGTGIGEPAVEINATSWLNSSDALSLEQLRGRVVLVEFWASYCSPCVSLMPHLNGLASKHAEAGLVVVGLTSEPAKVVKRFLASDRPKPAFAVGVGSKMWRTYGVKSIPYSVVVGRSGEVVWRGRPDCGLAAAIEEALRAEPSADAEPAVALASSDPGDGADPVRFNWPAIGREQLAGARALLAEGHHDEAASVLRFLAKRFSGMTVGAAATRQLLAVGG